MKAIMIAAFLGLAGMNAFAQEAGKAPAAAAQAAETDLKFIDSMSKHHEDGVKMAQMAQQKGSTKEVKAMGDKIAKDQTKEIEQMKTWRSRWYASAPNAQMEMPKMDMSQLESKTGHDFDMAFMDMMTKHHQDGMKMAQQMSPTLKHKELKEFSGKAVQNQKSEIEKMSKWMASMGQNHEGHQAH